MCCLNVLPSQNKEFIIIIIIIIIIIYCNLIKNDVVSPPKRDVVYGHVTRKDDVAPIN